MECQNKKELKNFSPNGSILQFKNQPREKQNQDLNLCILISSPWFSLLLNIYP